MLDTRLQVRMTQSEIEELKERAESCGFSVSDYIRYLLEESKGGKE